MAQAGPAIPKKIKLYYFDIEGRAEPIRLALKFAKIPFEDVRIPFQDWGALKPKTPFGCMPYMEIWATEEQKEPVVLAQSEALLRYAGKMAGLYPTDALEAAKVDQLLNCMEDMFGVLHAYWHSKGEEKLKLAKEIVETKKLEVWLQRLDKLVTPSGWFADGRMTIAELIAWPFYAGFGKLEGIPVSMLEGLKGLEKMAQQTKAKLA